MDSDPANTNSRLPSNPATPRSTSPPAMPLLDDHREQQGPHTREQATHSAGSRGTLSAALSVGQTYSMSLADQGQNERPLPSGSQTTEVEDEMLITQVPPPSSQRPMFRQTSSSFLARTNSGPPPLKRARTDPSDDDPHVLEDALSGAAAVTPLLLTRWLRGAVLRLGGCPRLGEKCLRVLRPTKGTKRG